jgi:hypothetical protein
MKYKVKGPRVLIEVKKFKKKDIEKFEGSMLYRADAESEDAQISETTGQCIGTVMELGSTAYKRKDSGCDGTAWCGIGDKVHFARYGAIRLAGDKEAEVEHWVINDKDVLVVEETKENVVR